MDISHLKAFVEVARVGQLTRAAANLHLTQPAVSQQLKHLRDFLGVELFHRTAQGLVLTKTGADLLPLAEKALLAVGDVVQFARGATSQVRGSLRLGTILDPEFTRLGLFLNTLVEQHAAVETRLEHGMSGSVYKKILSGDLDVGFFLGESDNKAVYQQPLARFVYKVLAPRGWQKRVQGKGWAELAALPWIWTPPESFHNRSLSQVFESYRVSPHAVAWVDQELSMLDMVKSGVGLSLARESLALRESQAHGLAIADAVEVPSVLSLICLQKRHEEVVIKAAFECLAAVWQ